MLLNPVLLESLLRQEEGPTLDFKRDQYPLNKGSSSDQKAIIRSELVKDILAFANAKRETTAYILIGVEEVKGGRSKVVGVHEQLDDADLHKLVNSKTQRPVEFSYSPFPIGDDEIGVIEIPVQERILFLTKSYGNLHENAVYIRDGSSTRTATPDEVAEMSTPKRPELVLAWADSEKSSAFPSPYVVKSLLLNPLLPEDTFNLPSPPGRSLYGVEIPSLFDSGPNPDYSRELIDYTYCKAFFMPLGLQLHNKSGVAATRVRFEGMLKKRDGFGVLDEFPSFPPETIDRETIDLMSTLNDMPYLNNQLMSRVHEARIELQEDSDHWKISVEFGDIRPDEKISTEDNPWFGSGNSGTVSLKGKLLGENISEPIQCSLDIRFETECRPMTKEDVDSCKRAYFDALGLEDI